MADLDMTDDWRILQGFDDYGYMVSGDLWGYISLWKVRILGRARDFRGRSAVRYEHVELVWHQPKARTEMAVTRKDGRIVRVFSTRADNVGSLQDACCKLGTLRDKHRSETLAYRMRLQETIRECQEHILVATARVTELDAFVPTAVVPGEVLEAELEAEDRALEELRAEG